MESNITPDPQSKQVTVEVPEDRVEEFHAFFERFLAAPSRRARRGRHGHHGHYGHGHRGRGCGRRSEHAERTQQSPESTEI